MSRRYRHPGDMIAALADGRLPEPDRSWVAAHVARCPQCLAEYDAQLAMKGVLGGLPEPGAPDELRERLVGLAAPEVPAPRRHRSRLERLTVVGGAALTVSIAVIGLAYAAGGTTDEHAVVPPLDRYVREHSAVSVGVPLTEPALSQLAKGVVPLLPPTAVPVVAR